MSGYSNEPVQPALLRAAFEELKARVDVVERELADSRARVEKLEAAKITLKDLPLKSLQNQLELNWHPNASVLLGERSISPEMIA